MKQSNHSSSDEVIQNINNIFHPMKDGSYYINHNCFLVENHSVVLNQTYLLFDFTGDSISDIISFRLENILHVNEFILVVGVDMLSGEEIGRNEYLVDNSGCSFKLLDFDSLKTIMNKTEVKHYC